MTWISGLLINTYTYDDVSYVLAPYMSSVYLMANNKPLFSCYHFCLGIINNTVCLLTANQNTINIYDISTKILIKTLVFDSVISFIYNEYLVVQHSNYVASYTLDIAFNYVIKYKLNKFARPLYIDDSVIVLSVGPEQEIKLYTNRFRYFYACGIYNAGACMKYSQHSVEIFTGISSYEQEVKYTFWHRLFCCL